MLRMLGRLGALTAQAGPRAPYAWTAIGLAAATMLGSTAMAQTKQQVAWCEHRETVDLEISGCTAVIQSENYSEKNLAWAFGPKLQAANIARTK